MNSDTDTSGILIFLIALSLMLLIAQVLRGLLYLVLEAF